ncbi:protein of unknown function (DUF3510) [Fragilaria crotonensis]|nr:protein of unknown function (DUF3510) [Fragilaria crotonensis]
MSDDPVSEADKGEEKEEDEVDIVSALSTMALEQKLESLRDQSNKHSQLLTQRLATSQSVLSAAETTEKQYLGNLQKLVMAANEIRLEQRRVEHSLECADLYEDLCAAEQHVNLRKRNILEVQVSGGGKDGQAHTALCLVRDLHTSSEQVSHLSSTQKTTELPSLKAPLDHDTERAQFVMKLAPRIRKLEADCLHSLSMRLEAALNQIQLDREEGGPLDDDQDAGSKMHHHEHLLIIGHYLRGLVILGKGQEAENAFARVAIMPLIRSKLSMGRLDQGGSRGECAGLPSLLQDILESISQTFGPVLRLSESIFDREVDLVTAGVWVPIATALMADAGVKMAIFSPGIASILQKNYLALDNFLSELASRLLSSETVSTTASAGSLEHLYYSPDISTETVARAQARVYAHPKTAEFTKKWNLPIYYQLRFGDCCSRLNAAVDRTQKEGWAADIYAGKEDELEKLRAEYGLELPLFIEVFVILSSFWNSDIFLRPLTHRFLRGAVQVVGRVAAFVEDGLEGRIQFGEEVKQVTEENGSSETNANRFDKQVDSSRAPYCWGEVLEDVAAVAWDLTVLESKLTHEYASAAVSGAVGVGASAEETEQMEKLVRGILEDAASIISPLVQKAWNKVIVELLISKCSGPLGAVKGVAATYRMTNRPSPTNPSPFVPTILRPLIQFNDEFRRKIPPPIGIRWKIAVVTAVADRYSAAVEELISTIQRTEVALQSRRARRTVAGGMSDGEKAKLQLYLDYTEFVRNVQLVGVDPSTVEGIVKLRNLTQNSAEGNVGNN